MTERKWDADFAVATGLYGLHAFLVAADDGLTAAWVTVTNMDVALGTYTEAATGEVKS